MYFDIIIIIYFYFGLVLYILIYMFYFMEINALSFVLVSTPYTSLYYSATQELEYNNSEMCLPNGSRLGVFSEVFYLVCLSKDTKTSLRKNFIKNLIT